MDKSKQSNSLCMNLEFVRSESKSQQEKVKDFWKYLDSQDILKPFRSPKHVDEDSAECVCRSSTESTSGERQCKIVSKNIEKKKSDKKSDDPICKLEKYFREDLMFADSVEVPYEELNAEIKDYERRLLRCGCENETCDCRRK